MMKSGRGGPGGCVAEALPMGETREAKDADVHPVARWECAEASRTGCCFADSRCSTESVTTVRAAGSACAGTAPRASARLVSPILSQRAMR